MKCFRTLVHNPPCFDIRAEEKPCFSVISSEGKDAIPAGQCPLANESLCFSFDNIDFDSIRLKEPEPDTRIWEYRSTLYGAGADAVFYLDPRDYKQGIERFNLCFWMENIMPHLEGYATSLESAENIKEDTLFGFKGVMGRDEDKKPYFSLGVFSWDGSVSVIRADIGEEWNHIAISTSFETDSHAVVRLYINGEYMGYASAGYDAGTLMSHERFSIYSVTGGLLDQLRFWDKTLTENEVLTCYNEPTY